MIKIVQIKVWFSQLFKHISKNLLCEILIFIVGIVIGIGATMYSPFLRLRSITNNTNQELSKGVKPTVSIITPIPVNPTAQALKIAAYVYVNVYPRASMEEKQKFDAQYGSSEEIFIKNYALSLDNDPVRFAKIEAKVEKDKTDQQNVVNQPEVVYRNNPAPIIQNTSPKYCTSNTVGSYTYTNCY